MIRSRSMRYLWGRASASGVEDKRMAQGYVHPQEGHHECEILGSGPEAEESEGAWKECKKNPGHEKFFSAQNFLDSSAPSVQTDKLRDTVRAMVDLTVRLRVNWTSPGRPNGFTFSHVRGCGKLRLGTGFIWNVEGPVCNKRCFCDECRGQTAAKSWTFRVRTAHHVVYDTEEAKETKVDLFYDDDSCKPGSKMATVSVRGLEVVNSYPHKDICHMLCVTHNEALAERVQSARRCWFDGPREIQDLSALDFVPPCGRGADLALIVSHPHGQAKKITVGALRRCHGGFAHVEYNAATCPGSSGAPVFRFDTERHIILGWWSLPVHSGGFFTSSTQRGGIFSLTGFLNKLRGRKTKLTQRNYGNLW
ncbi:hypothetical protein EGW08_017470 [Elysia chlorotica]|uniref:Peptidase S1 domain-containing protein n=1 Tax=Elysia chlorotica TaxID=188477 RepID=A0A433SZS2_ELYCH|nr:hypothetical protein EGW08_017470 [Elysia chlorotica]